MSDETKQRVLEAAGPIFAEQGYGAATIREICSAAGANLASVNYHFGGKAGLYLETVQLAYRRRSAQVPAPEWSADTPPEEKLRSFIRTLLNRILPTRDADWPMRLLMREMLQPTHACHAVVEEYIRPQFERLMQVIGEMVPAGTRRCDRERLAFSIVGQCLHYRMVRGFSSLLLPLEEWNTLTDVESLTEHITSFSLAGIRQRSGRGSSRHNNSPGARHSGRVRSSAISGRAGS